ncbi:uncharacterized protein BP01DRAFT_410944 [Aspergillus saccharolyticus JOP 1030-1]|uniref:C2H2-type domain-containing protein n=1 Tax=Aspergillus saccharolyticus JOP 1030-1 TaxID=1450539 RepID=A0A318YZS3_9EURO|nr:hypothetical protein BP01DRAFT_410944 [Aspergillus saccharolyticus JOP 1030-1]PYH40216.1 hypothetical protein BP01DRAFT_410944 [Aspergillus saccharolyticus JOP 1030-1]
MASNKAIQRLRSYANVPSHQLTAPQVSCYAGRHAHADDCRLCGHAIFDLDYADRCGQCGRFFHQHCIERLQQSEARNGTPIALGCPQCGTLWNSAIVDRCRYRKSGDTYICEGGDRCEFATRDRETLDLHYCRNHGDTRESESGRVQQDMPGQNPVPCPHCLRRFASQEGLNHHMDMAHPEFRTAELRRDDRSERREYRNERREYRGDRRNCDSLEFHHHCPHCSRIFYNERGLKSHVSDMHADEIRLKPTSQAPWPCSYCSRRFTNQRGVSAHIGNMHPEVIRRCEQGSHPGAGFAEPTVKNICPWCLQGPVPRPEDLTTHVGTQHYYDTLTCPFCAKQCYSRGKLEKHMTLDHDY